MYKALLGATVIAMALSVTACGGSTTTVKQTDTQGKQLLDLKEAKDQGVITDKEYEKTKKKILSGK